SLEASNKTIGTLALATVSLALRQIVLVVNESSRPSMIISSTLSSIFLLWNSRWPGESMIRIKQISYYAAVATSVNGYAKMYGNPQARYSETWISFPASRR
ncbi:MAG TPA: hypothetical protein VFS81_24250, partial [Candidatus Binatia bacterium]|nr:hypothetical protein [Candidatus Binatia bacterium]